MSEGNFLQQAVKNINLNGVYYTPEIIKNKIQMEATNAIIGGPPFKTKAKKTMVVYCRFFGL